MSNRILLIDHDAGSAERLRTALIDAGHDVNLAVDADRAVEGLARNGSDLVLIAGHAPDPVVAQACRTLKRSAPDTLVAVVAEVGAEPEAVSGALGRFGCDQVIDRSVPVERLVAIVGKLLAAARSRAEDAVAAPAAVAEAGQSPGLLDSDELVNALEKLGTIMAHRAAGQVAKPGGAGEAPSETPPAAPTPARPSAAPNQPSHPAADFSHLEQETNRDAPQAPGGDAPDSGGDIEAHLDSIFSDGLPETEPRPDPAVDEPPAPAAAANVPSHTVRRAPVPPEVVASPEPVPVPVPVAEPQTDGGGAEPPVAPEPAPAVVAADPSPTVPAAEPSSAVPGTAASAVPPELLGAEDLASAGGGHSLRWLVAATVVIALLGAGYMLMFRDRGRAPTTVAMATPVTPQEPSLPQSPVSVPEGEPMGPEGPEASGSSEEDRAATARAAAGALPRVAPARPMGTPAPAGPTGSAATRSPAATSEPVPVRATRPEPVSSPTTSESVPTPRPSRVEPAPTPAATRSADKPAPTPVPARPTERSASTPAPARPTQSPAPAEAAAPKVEKQTPPPKKPAATPVEPAAPVPAQGTVTPSPSAAVRPDTPAPEAEEPQAPAPGTPPAPPREPVFEPPRVLERTEPTYSRKSLKGVDDPEVVLKVLVDDRGRIARVVVDRGIPGSDLEAAAISAVLRWKFAPATRDGQPVESWTRATFNFE